MAWKGDRPDWPEAAFQMSSHTYFPPWPSAHSSLQASLSQPDPAPSALPPILALERRVPQQNHPAPHLRARADIHPREAASQPPCSGPHPTTFMVPYSSATSTCQASRREAGSLPPESHTCMGRESMRDRRGDSSEWAEGLPQSTGSNTLT